MVKRTEKSRYVSRYGASRAITPSQFVVEFVCENKAKLDGVHLPPRFWNLPQWTKFFREQVTAANELLKHYEVADVVAALRSPKASRVKSLRAPFLAPIIQEEERKRVALEKRQADVPFVEFSEPKALEVPRPQVTKKKNVLDKLKELE